MSYYIRIAQLLNGTLPQVWKIDEDIAIRIGISNAEGSPGAFFKADPGETVWAKMKRETPWFLDGEPPFHKTVLSPGEYYRRIARPGDQHPDQAPGRCPNPSDEADTIAVARGQLTALTRQLDRICRTVHPSPATFSAFGHDLRNLLILACTEVESHWRGVLVSNGEKKEQLTRKDYMTLSPAMRLGEYSVKFPSYPWLEPIRPFAGWRNLGTSNAGLKWYDAYNAVKHNREARFEEATLEHAFEAVAACAIMIAAQFGFAAGLGQRSEVADFFRFSTVPKWPLSDVHIHPYGSEAGAWVAVPYPFKSPPIQDHRQESFK